MTTRLAESPGRPLERHGNVSPREMTVHGVPRDPRTEPGVQAGPFAPPDRTTDDVAETSSPAGI